MKVVLIGDGNTGKTTYMQCLCGGEFTIQSPTPTNGVAIFQNFIYNGVAHTIWDTGGMPENVGLEQGYYIDADCAFAFFTHDSNFERSNMFVKKFRNICPDKPIIYILNKIDISSNLYGKNKYYYDFCKISGKSGINIYRPFDLFHSHCQYHY